MGTVPRLTALASLALVSACAIGGAATSSAPERSAPAAVRHLPTATPTADSIRTSTSGPPTTIPDEVGLPHQWTWVAYGDARSRPLPDLCLDPPPALRPPEPTDHRGRSDTDGRTSRSESLGVYADPEDARRAVLAWRRQIDRCYPPGSANHVGVPTRWSFAPLARTGADAAWQALALSIPAAGQGDDLASAWLTTVVRVGNAVYAETVTRPGRPDDRTADRAASSVTAYVPTLAVFREG